MPAARDGECLPVLDSVHDLSGSVSQIALGDFRLSSHKDSIPGHGTQCYAVLQARCGSVVVAGEVLTPVGPNIHANKAGYEEIADTFEAAAALVTEY
jgi:hypothetical protein